MNRYFTWFLILFSVLHLFYFALCFSRGISTTNELTYEQGLAFLATTKEGRSPLLICIVCDARSIWTLGPVVMQTWAKDIGYDVRFFVGNEATQIPRALEPYTTRLTSPDGMPVSIVWV